MGGRLALMGVPWRTGVPDPLQQVGEVRVQLDDLPAMGVVGFLPPGKDGEGEDLRLGIKFVELLRDGLHALRSLPRGVAAPADVVGADQDHCGLRRFLQFREVIEPPQDV